MEKTHQETRTFRGDCYGRAEWHQEQKELILGSGNLKKKEEYVSVMFGEVVVVFYLNYPTCLSI